jgi:hypothetical protein
MLHRTRPTHPSRRLRRTLAAIAGGALLLLTMSAGPAGATVTGRDRYHDDYAFSFDDCGFWIDVTGHVEGVAQLRVGKGEFQSAFFLHDNYAFRETSTRRDTGEFFVASGNGLFHETKASHISGTIYEFTSINAGQPFVVRDSHGDLVLRDRGVIRQVLQFDTLGDDVPGGAFVKDVSFSVHGPHPGLVFDACALLD